MDVALPLDTIFFLPWGSVPCVHAEFPPHVHRLTAGLSLGRDESLVGCGGPGAALWSSRASPLRLNTGMSLKAYQVCSFLQRGK